MFNSGSSETMSGARGAAEIREALTLALDGCFQHDDDDPCHAYAAALALTGAKGDLLSNGPTRPHIAGVPSRFDRVHDLLEITGAPPLLVPEWNAGFPAVPVAFLGCCGLTAHVEEGVIERFLDGGGLLITSDRAAELPALRWILLSDGRGSPRRARVVFHDTALEAADEPSRLLPAVHLAGGHTRLSPSMVGNPGVEVLASDALDDAPLVVLVRARRGRILHSVAHWFQDDATLFTAVERRLLSQVPGCGEIAARYPGLTFGALSAAVAMVTALRLGLRRAFSDDRQRRTTRDAGHDRAVQDA